MSKPDPKATPTPAAPPATPPEDTAKIRQEAESKVALAQQREQLAIELARRAVADAQARAAQAQPQAVQPDFIERAITDDITVPVNERRNALYQALEARAAQERQTMEQQLEQRFQAERAATSNEMMVNSLKTRRPDIAQNSAKFSGAFTEAIVEAREKGENVGQDELLRRAEKVYDERYKTSVVPTNAPRTEFGSRPDLSTNPDQPRLEKSELEERYGIKAGGIDPFPRNWDDMNRDYLVTRNKQLLDRNINISDPGLEQAIMQGMSKPDA